jgi:hypothetical protein
MSKSISALFLVLSQKGARHQSKKIFSFILTDPAWYLC